MTGSAGNCRRLGPFQKMWRRSGTSPTCRIPSLPTAWMSIGPRGRMGRCRWCWMSMAAAWPWAARRTIAGSMPNCAAEGFWYIARTIAWYRSTGSLTPMQIFLRPWTRQSGWPRTLAASPAAFSWWATAPALTSSPTSQPCSGVQLWRPPLAFRHLKRRSGPWALSAGCSTPPAGTRWASPCPGTCTAPIGGRVRLHPIWTRGSGRAWEIFRRPSW